MPIKGKRVFYQKSEIFIAGASSNGKLEAYLKTAFSQLTTHDQRVVTMEDQSEWHLNSLDVHADYVFFHIVHLKPGYERSGYRKRANAAQRVVSVAAGVDTEFVLHDVCGLVSDNHVVAYGGIHNDRSLFHYVNGLLKKARAINSVDFVAIDNVLKASTVQEIERYGVEDINLDAVQNAEVIGLGAHQRTGLLGRLINSPLAQHEKIKVRLHINANGHFRKSRDEIDGQMLDVAKNIVGTATDEDWDGIKITLKNGTVLKKGSHLVAEDLPISRVGECLNVSEAAPLMYEFFNKLKRARQLVRD